MSVFQVQIRDANDSLLSEWVIAPGDDGSSVDVVREIAWLREPFGQTTKAGALASAPEGADNLEEDQTDV